jgi:hypothetical protein
MWAKLSHKTRAAFLKNAIHSFLMGCLLYHRSMDFFLRNLEQAQTQAKAAALNAQKSAQSLAQQVQEHGKVLAEQVTENTKLLAEQVSPQHSSQILH